jgi:hypothetical protein
MRDSFATWHDITRKPIINADIGNWLRTATRSTGLSSQAERGANYCEALAPLIAEPWFLGWHWCAYVENHHRGWGLKDPQDEPYRELVEPVTDFNRRIYDMVG